MVTEETDPPTPPSNVHDISETQARRLALQFIDGPRPKFILSSAGIILAKNRLAEQMISEGVVSLHNERHIEYGSSDLNTSARSIINAIKAGRSECKRLLKQTPNGGWSVLEFSKIDVDGRMEILLTFIERKFCREESLEALSNGFGFTLTETEVVRHMIQAFCPKEIAAEMGISVNTVRAHLRSIYSKTGVRGFNRALRLILELT